jgi:RND family efflux transporter MFP subunit
VKPAKIAVSILVIVITFLAGVWVSYHSTTSKSTPGGRKILYWHDPMHPAYKSDKPGIAPDCGMQLEPVYEDGGPSGDARPDGLPPGAFQVNAEKQQLIGLRLAAVGKSSGSRTVRSIGRVSAEEARIYPIAASVSGWITAARPFSTGDFVKKDTVLARLYSPEFVTSLRGLSTILNSIEWYEKSRDENPGAPARLYQYDVNLQQSKDTLRNQGMSESQLERFIKTRQIEDNIDIVSPSDGFILKRRVAQGLRFNKGDDFYLIADLSRVWILVDVFEQEEKYLRPGARVRVTLPNQGSTLRAQVSTALPQFDASSRTLKVRLEADNPGFRMRPDMFVDVEIPASYGPSTTVPAQAVLNTGKRKVVFVDLGNGYFEPRQVQTGWQMDGAVEITGGLAEGERIVVSGNFLLDSESRLKLAAAGLPEDHAVDPVCGMGVDPRKADEKKTIYQGQTYYFCNPDCKAKFEAEPEKYAQKEAEARNQVSRGRIQNSEFRSQKSMGDDSGTAERRPKTAKDLVCGMDVDTSAPGVLTSRHMGKTYYFCNSTCKSRFDEDPAKYLLENSEGQAGGKTARDLVCGMDVDTSASGVLKADYQGKTYYFCNPSCKESFLSNPAKYLSK